MADDTEQTADLTDEQLEKAKSEMRAGGVERGKAAASWLLDGNSSDADARELLRQCEECELDQPSPLSGEWADDPTLADLIGEFTEWDADTLTPEERDELATAFEDGYSEGYSLEAEASARRMLAD